MKKFVFVGATVAIAVFCAGVAIGQSRQFNDVPPDHYAYAAVEWAVDHGITDGCGDGTNFCPDTKLNRAEIVTFLKRYDDWVQNGRPSPSSGLNAGIGAEAACLYTDRGCPIEKSGTFGVPRNTLLIIGRDIAPGRWFASVSSFSGRCTFAWVTERIKDHPDYVPPGERWTDWISDFDRVRGYTGYDYEDYGYESIRSGTIVIEEAWAVIFESHDC